MVSVLENLGNTCYINVVLLCLSGLKLPDTQNQLVQNLKKLLEVVATKNVIIKPVTLYNYIKKEFPKYNNNDQHDTKEFFLDLIEYIHKHTSTPVVLHNLNPFSSKHFLSSTKEWSNYFEDQTSIIDHHFYGQYLTSIKCCNCQFVRYKYDPFLVLQVKPKNEIVSNLIKESLLEDYTNMECSECKDPNDNEDNCADHLLRPEHSINTRLYKLPECLIVSVNCFNNDLTKNNEKIILEKEIDLYESYLTNTCETVVYTLQSVIYHVGSTDKGHYLNCVTKNRKDYLISDTFVKETRLESINESPFMIFYTKKIN
jgi:ubiquitin C-terminal hydrolase